MATDPPFVPDWASPPGESIADIIRERWLMPLDVAKALDMNLDQFVTFLSGGTAITPKLAKKLEEVLGGPAEFWLTRDRQYRELFEQGQALNAIVDRVRLQQLDGGEEPGGELSDAELLVAEILRLRHSNAVLDAELCNLRVEHLQLTMRLEIAQHNRRLSEEAPSQREGREGSLYFRLLEDGHEVIVYPMLGNRARLCLGDGDVSIVDAFCYDSPARAIEAAQVWDGSTDPLDGWTKNPFTGRRRPGGDPAKEHRDGEG